MIWRRWKGRHPTGIDRVCLAYLRHFGPNAQAVVQRNGFRRILDRDTSQRLFSLLEKPAGAFKTQLFLGSLGSLAGTNGNGKSRIYLNVGHTGLNSLAFRKWVQQADLRPIYFVHDLIPITDPEFCREGETDKHRERMRTVLTTGAGVIANSQSTLHDLAAFASEENLPRPPALAAWLGMEPLPKAAAPGEPGRLTFVTIGTIEGRKNHLLLLNIWRRLVDRLGHDAPRLLIIGQRGWKAEEVFSILDHDETLRGHVVEIGGCSDDDLANHLRSARALVFPSRAEGYGLPLVEALGLGVPVIASDLPVFHEIGGDIPDYLDPLDSSAWESAIVDYSMRRSVRRSAQLQRIQSFRLPDWASHFEAVEGWLRGLGGTAEADNHRLDEGLDR